MRKNRILVIIFTLKLLILWSCNSELKKEFYKDGSLKTTYQIEKGEIQGEVKEYYPNGNIKSISHFENGIQQGKMIVYHLNGKPYKHLSFKNGLQIDSSFIYDEHGKLLELSVFENGNRNGYFIQYFDNGKIMMEGNVVNDMEDGIWYFYNRKGSKSVTRFFESGKLDTEYVDSTGFYYNLIRDFSFYLRSEWKIIDISHGISILRKDNQEFPTITILVNSNDNELNSASQIQNDLDSLIKLNDFKLQFREINQISYSALIENTKYFVNTYYKSIAEQFLIITMINDMKDPQFNQEFDQIIKSISVHPQSNVF